MEKIKRCNYCNNLVYAKIDVFIGNLKKFMSENNYRNTVKLRNSGYYQK